MTRVAILGATGYSALELIKILLRHPGAQITAATSRQEGSPPLASVHPSLTGRIAINLEDLSPAAVAARAECVFSCLPHGVTAKLVPQLLEANCRVIDFSADYRLRDAEVYQQWYGEKHADPQRLSSAVYGLPELFRAQIATAALVANPGCYPTSAILALAPLLKAGLIEPDGPKGWVSWIGFYGHDDFPFVTWPASEHRFQADPPQHPQHGRHVPVGQTTFNLKCFIGGNELLAAKNTAHTLNLFDR